MDVSVGVVKVGATYLVAKRLASQTFGGKWEFPGGKLEQGETPYDALCRELDEEIGIGVQAARPLIQVPYVRGHVTIRLHVWLVTDYRGNPVGRLGQMLAYHTLDELKRLEFPEANRWILNALALPDKIAICDMASFCIDDLHQLARRTQFGLRLRQGQLDALRYQDLVYKALFGCRSLFGGQMPLMLLDLSHAWSSEKNHALRIAFSGTEFGFHLTGQQAKKMNAEQAGSGSSGLNGMFRLLKALPAYIGMSCHNAEEIRIANALGVDYCFISPVQATPTHPDAVPIGWDGFAQLTRVAMSPAYALGGMCLEDLPEAHERYSQGVAGKSWWRNTH